jgi:hypothetical protein
LDRRRPVETGATQSGTQNGGNHTEQHEPRSALLPNGCHLLGRAGRGSSSFSWGDEMSKTTKNRKSYRNGDPITLACGCDGCSPSMVNGILCHETGCPDAWRDDVRECDWCGRDFAQEERTQRFCDESCAAAYHGRDLCEDWDKIIEEEEAELQDA